MTIKASTNNLPPGMTKRRIGDGLVNVASGLGTGKSKRSQNTFQFDMLNSWQELDAAYQTNWLSAKIVDIPAEDMCREWRRIKCDGAEDIVALEDEHGVPEKVQEALSWARLYGGGGILMITDQDLEKPLNVEAVKKGSLQKLVVFDRWDLTPGIMNTFDVLADNYMQPEYYTLRNGSQRIHWTHVAKFMGKKLPRRWQEKTHGWGDSILRKCIEDVMDTVAAKDGIAELMQEANVDVIKSEGLADDLASDMDDDIIKRYQVFSQMKSIINMALLDGDETLERQTLNLSGVAPIIEQLMTWISAAADIPVTRMFGTSAKGMSATGEGDETNYNNSLRAGQKRDLAPGLRVLDEVLVRSALGNYPDDYSYVWNPLQQPNELEIAQAEHLRAQKHVMYLDQNVVQRSQVMRELQGGEEYQYNEEELDELEELEEGNLFDEVPDPDESAEMSGGMTPDPAQEAANFADAYTAMNDAGMSHDEIMGYLAA